VATTATIEIVREFQQTAKEIKDLELAHPPSQLG
jgi:hypothetical protein